MSPNSGNNPKKSKKEAGPLNSTNFWMVAIFGVLISVIGGYLFRLNQMRIEGEKDRQAESERLTKTIAQLLPLKNQAIGELENQTVGRAEFADEAFSKIASELPDDPLGPNNLIVTRILRLDNLVQPEAQGAAVVDPQARKKAKEAAQTALLEALEKYRSRLAKGWRASVLEAIAYDRLSQATEDENLQTEYDNRFRDAMLAASEAEPNNPSIPWYYAKGLVRLSAKYPQLAEERGPAIRKVMALVPKNLAAIVNVPPLWEGEAKPSEEDIRQVAEGLAELGPRIVEQVNLTENTDPDRIKQLLGEASDLVKQAKWPQAANKVRSICNSILSSELQKSDLALLDLHPVELVIHEFGGENGAPMDASEADLKPMAYKKLETIAQVAKAVAIADVNLDGVSEIVALGGSELKIYERDAKGAWSVITTIPVSASATGMRMGVLARLESRLDKPKDDLPTAATSSPSERRGNQAVVGCNSQPNCRVFPPDIVVYGPEGIEIHQNKTAVSNGVTTFETIAAPDAMKELKGIRTLEMVDLEADGDLDFAVATNDGLRLFTNLAEYQFREISSAFVGEGPRSQFNQIAFADWDRDVDLDLIVVGDDGAVSLVENLLHNQFRFRPLSREKRLAKAISIVEWDGNVSWDLLSVGDAATVDLTTSSRWKNSSAKTLTQNMKSVIQNEATAVISGDLDNDGWIDALAWSNEQIVLLRNRGGTLALETLNEPKFDSIASVELVDVNGDGSLEFVVADAQGIHILGNASASDGYWLNICAVGLMDSLARCNNAAIGSTIEIRSGSHYQAQVVSRQHTHFGLGSERQADVVRIIWTNGLPQSLVKPESQQTLCEEMLLLGSCPYLYAWNGESYEFLTDCLWAAPLGLQVAEGRMAPSRPWEYLLISGDQLKPKNGAYSLQVTEELWEAGYFDKMELLAIDHPADFEVYSNEKVGPARIAEFKVHTVRERLYPRSALDQLGRDWLPTISKRDGRYTKCFDSRLCQGLTPEHYLELDLGAMEADAHVKLYLTGWIYPTDASLNVQISQHPTWEAPKFPTLLIADGAGGWRELDRPMGFPGGKTKTMAVDLEGAFPTSDHRVRIVTTAEIFWDEIFFTRDESDAEVRVSAASPRTADLHYRGFSRVTRGQHNGPESFDYQDVSTTPKWPPMRGEQTRYGDVNELLLEEDDRLVVMSSGDEMTVEFAIEDFPPVPLGWKRDFFLHSVGWDKDANLNTVTGQHIDPLPYVRMPGYPYSRDHAANLESARTLDEREFNAFLSKYQRREAKWETFWRSIQVGGD